MSLEDALNLLAKNKSVGDEVFRGIYADPLTKYAAVKESIAAFQNASQDKRIMNNIPLVARYVRVLAILVEQEQHTQHLSVADWASLVGFLGTAYGKLAMGPRERGFIKNVFDLFRSLAILLEASESIDSDCFGLILDLCEDFCGSGQQRETSCHQFVMTCVRILTQCRFERAHYLGKQLIQIGKPRQERLRREMFAFSCLVPQSLDDLASIGPVIIESYEIEFSPATDLGFGWFRPSPDAELSKFIGAKALAAAKCNRSQAALATTDMPAPKRQKTNYDELILMASAFGYQDDLSVLDLLAWPSRSFWVFVVLAQKISLMTRKDLLEVWRMATDHIQYASTASSACFCLALLVPQLAHPNFIDDGILARFETLLFTMGESSYPVLSSGSLLLWNALSSIRVLNREFQTLKKSKLRLWLGKCMSHLPDSLLTTFFGVNCDIYHIDIRGLERLKSIHLFQRINKLVGTLDPRELSAIQASFVPAEAVLEPQVMTPWVEARTVRDALWSLAILAHSGQSTTKLEPQSSIKAISDDDVRSIIWFANLACTKLWPREYFDLALAILENLKAELLNADNEIKAQLDLSLALLENSASTVAFFVAGRPEALEIESPATAIRSLQHVFQSYSLQRSPFVVGNILRLLENPRYARLPEYTQLMLYFKSFINDQSSYSRLRPAVARLMVEGTDFVDLIKHSCLDNALVALPTEIKSDKFTLELLYSLDLQGRKIAGYVLLSRGASPAQVIAFLFKEKLLRVEDLSQLAAMLNMKTSHSLMAAIAIPLIFGPFADVLEPLFEFSGSSALISVIKSSHSRFLASSRSLTDAETALVTENIMQGFSLLSSAEEKVECIRLCWLFVRAHNSEISSDTLSAYIKGATALSRSIVEPHIEALEAILSQLLNDSKSIHGYSDLAADIAFMGFPDLARKVGSTIEAANSELAEIVWSFDNIRDCTERAPALLYDLTRASNATTYEIWSLVIQKLLMAASQNIKPLARAFCDSPKIKELAGALQLWTKRLSFTREPLWMSFMGYVAAEVGELPPQTILYGVRTTISEALIELARVYSGLPYSKKWYLHHLYRRIEKDSSALPQSVNFGDDLYVVLDSRHSESEYATTVYSHASRLASIALEKHGLPALKSVVFDEIPELIADFVPLLGAAGLEPHHYMYITELLEGNSDERELALRVMKRYYEATRSFMGLESVLVEACERSGEEFSELGIACVEMIWGAEKENIPKTIMKSLLSFYAKTKDHIYEHLAHMKADARNLSLMRMASSWQELDFNLLTCEVTGDDVKLQHSLERTGLWKLASKSPGMHHFYDYEQAWWMQQWDLPPAPKNAPTTSPLLDPTEEVFGALFNLFCGHSDEIETFSKLCRIDFTKPRILGSMLDNSGSINFDLPVIRQGREILALRSGSKEELAKELTGNCSRLRKAGELNESTKYAVKLERLAKDTESATVKAMSLVESSHTAWSFGDQTLALSLLHDIVQLPTLYNHFSKSSDLSSIDGDYTLAKIYCRLGTWARLARNEPDEVILREYFTKAEECTGERDIEQVHHYFAHFCDDASHDPALVEELEDLERMRMQRERELNHLKAVAASSQAEKGVNRKISNVQKVLDSETSDFTSLLDRKKQLSLQCAESYLKSLKAGESYPEDTSCFVAIWLELWNDVPVNQRIHTFLAKEDASHLLARKFLPWMNQLTSRLGKANDEFQKALQYLITTALERHPYHTLWQLINLYWSGTSADTASMERKDAAKVLMARVRGRKQRSNLLRDLTACARQMLTLMKVPVNKKAKSLAFCELGKDSERWWRRDLVKMNLPVPTSTIVPRDDGDYITVPVVVSVDSNVTVAGGLSSPKILSFVTSDGKTTHMVLKHGTDDLRQDSIMQQVFKISDDLLAASKGKDLRVRTYNVIPLGPAGGAIEFVERAPSLLEILEPLHQKFGGYGEYRMATARNSMRRVDQEDKAVRIRVYKDIMEHTKPQMRRIWQSITPNVHMWLKVKTTWSRSTAVSSIIGYVVGLGDRHCSNLLVDTASGEVIHIDLGIAFDQGRFLSIPETVPFRLTRDVEDGMGVCGLDGPFTLSARTTLSVVREQQSRIMTVLEVLKHDALYSWRLPPLRRERAKAGQVEEEPEPEPVLSEPSVTPNSTTGQAESALRGVKQKLSSSLNVEATVRDLVARARDPANLAVIFSGWTPFY